MLDCCLLVLNLLDLTMLQLLALVHAVILGAVEPCHHLKTKTSANSELNEKQFLAKILNY
jgi:hypothetical protein